MLIFKHMCVASDSRTNVVAMLLFVENEYEICISVRSTCANISNICTSDVIYYKHKFVHIIEYVTSIDVSIGMIVIHHGLYLYYIYNNTIIHYNY